MGIEDKEKNLNEDEKKKRELRDDLNYGLQSLSIDLNKLVDSLHKFSLEELENLERVLEKIEITDSLSKYLSKYR